MLVTKLAIKHNSIRDEANLQNKRALKCEMLVLLQEKKSTEIFQKAIIRGNKWMKHIIISAIFQSRVAPCGSNPKAFYDYWPSFC